MVIVDSVSYAQGLSKIFKEIGSSLAASSLECLKHWGAHQEYDKQYYKIPITNKRVGLQSKKS